MPLSTTLPYVESRRRISRNGLGVLIVFLPPALLLFTVFVFLPMTEASCDISSLAAKA